MGNEYCDNLRNTFASNIFPWYYNSHVAGPDIDEAKEFFFTHMIFDWKERKVNVQKIINKTHALFITTASDRTQPHGRT